MQTAYAITCNGVPYFSKDENILANEIETTAEKTNHIVKTIYGIGSLSAAVAVVLFIQMEMSSVIIAMIALMSLIFGIQVFTGDKRTMQEFARIRDKNLEDKQELGMMIAVQDDEKLSTAHHVLMNPEEHSAQEVGQAQHLADLALEVAHYKGILNCIYEDVEKDTEGFTKQVHLDMTIPVIQQYHDRAYKNYIEVKYPQ